MRCLLHGDKQGAVREWPGGTAHHVEAASVGNPICAGYPPPFSRIPAMLAYGKAGAAQYWRAILTDPPQRHCVRLGK